MTTIDGVDYAPQRTDDGTNRVLVAVDLDLISPNDLLWSQVSPTGYGHAAVGHILATAVAEAVANAPWPTSVEVRGVYATLDGFSAVR